jgi:xanthine dehydrogenase large subunit
MFHSEFFPNDDNVENVARSKAVGEPPLMHAICVWTAVKHALRCVAPKRHIDLRLPATGEEILRCLTALESKPAVHHTAVESTASSNGAPANSPQASPRPIPGS